MGISYDVYKIAENLNITPAELYQLANRRRKNYIKMTVLKSGGGMREISAPNSFLKCA